MTRIAFSLILFGLWASAQDQAKGRIEGKAVDAVTKAPLRKANIVLSGGADGRGAFSAVTDASGSFVFDKLAAGTYRLIGEKSGYVRSSYGARTQESPGTPMVLGQGDEKKGLLLQLTPQAVLSGRIVDEDGDPLEGVQVSLQRRMFINGARRLGPAGQAQTNDRGEFRLSGIGAGKYLVMAVHNRFGVGGGLGAREQSSTGYVPTYHPGVERSDQAQLVELAAGQELVSFSMALRKSRTFRVRGRFAGAAPEDQAQAGRRQVNLKLKTSSEEAFGAGMFGGKSTNLQIKEGAFELNGVTPGSYLLDVVEFGNRGPKLLGRTEVTVSDANIDEVEVPEVQPASLTGIIRVVDETKPINVKGLQLSLQAVEGGMMGNQNLERKDGGRFEAKELSPERWRLMLFAGGQPVYVKSIQAAGRDLEGGIVELGSGGSAEVEIVLSGAVASIAGSVEREGTERPWGTVIVKREGKAISAGTMPNGLDSFSPVDSNGKFRSMNLGPGEYRVYAFEEFSLQSMDPEALKKLESKSLKLKLDEGEAKTVTLKQISWEELNKALQSAP